MRGQSEAASSRVLWIVDPSLRHPEDQGIGEILNGWPGRSRVFRPALREGDGPTHSDGYDMDGVVIMGSAASVGEPPPWMGPLAEWLGPILSGESPRPVLGICFGHQLIAHLTGGRVDYVHPDRRKLRSVERTTLLGGRLLHAAGQLRVVVSHREEVKRLPEGYRVTAQRELVAVDGMEHLRLPVFSFQFHPEAREEFARRAGIGDWAIDDEVRRDSRRLLCAFRAFVLSRSAGLKKNEPTDNPPARSGVG